MAFVQLHQTLTPEQRRQALADGDIEAAGFPHSSAAKPQARQRARARNLLAQPQVIDDIMERLAEGETITAIAQDYGVRYAAFYQILTNKYGDKVKAARAAHAEKVVSKNLMTADAVEAGRVDAAAGRTAAGIRQWYAERASTEDWGQKSSVDVNHRGVIGLHMEALKQFNNDNEQPVEDAEFEEISGENEDASSVPSNIEDHPLL